MIIPHLLLFLGSLLFNISQATILHTGSRWILNESNQRIKLRCVNWAGHGETKVPEGLAAQPVDKIVSKIVEGGFNCVRLTYAIDMALNPGQSVQASFSAAASSTGQSSLNSLYTAARSKNSFLSGSTRDAFGAVVSALDRRNILVILDNHVSRAQWCCSTSDGNGWWASASGYNDANSRYFNTQNWLDGLSSMATWARGYNNIVGLSLRNELRATGSQDANNHADWYTFVSQGASSIHQANPDALVIIGGVGYATDLSYLYSKPLDRSALGIASKTVWEFHAYQWSSSTTSSCPSFTSWMGNAAGYLLTQNKAYTGPLWLSEFGWNQNSMSSAEKIYWDCLRGYLEGNDAEWAYWALQGNYYIREGIVDHDESFGLLSRDWSTWRNSGWKSTFGTGIFTMNQGP